MERKFVENVVRGNVIVGLVAAVGTAYFYGITNGLGVFFGACWASGNLLVIKSLLTSVFLPEGANPFALLFGLAVKFPLVYFLGFLLLKQFSSLSLIGGFSLQFIVMTSMATSLFFQQKVIEENKMGQRV